MNYEIFYHGRLIFIKNVNHLKENGDNFTFYNNEKQVIAVINKSDYSSIIAK